MKIKIGNQYLFNIIVSCVFLFNKIEKKNNFNKCIFF